MSISFSSVLGNKNMFLLPNSFSKLCILVIFVLFGANIYAQITARLQAVYKIETLHRIPDDTKPATLALTKKILGALEMSNYILNIENEKSLFQKEDLLAVDEDALFSDIANIFAKVNLLTYTDKKKNEQIVKKEVLGKNYILYNQPVDFNWKLTGMTKMIKNIPCQKAEGSYYNEEGKLVKVDAWYSTTIPLQFGPDIFQGLPGLILEVVFDEQKIYLEKLNFNPKRNFVIHKPVEGEEVSQEEIHRRSQEALKRIGM